MSSCECFNEIALIRQTKSGLQMILCIAPKSSVISGNNEIPILLFQNDTEDRIRSDNMLSISIDASNPLIIDKEFHSILPYNAVSDLQKWIIKNYPLLMKYWNGEIYEDELIDGIQRL